uniref:Uncharacterized protein n=1 Tax=Ditylenchus dipsaci TaxID=166011 RepID=A0A915EPF0_9BILA
MSTVNEKQLSTLEELNASKRVVVVLIKWKYPFFTELQNFQKPKDAGLVGIFAEQTKAQMFEGFDKHFDLIFWYKADYTSLKVSTVTQTPFLCQKLQIWFNKFPKNFHQQIEAARH